MLKFLKYANKLIGIGRKYRRDGGLWKY